MFSFIQKQFRHHSLYDFTLMILRHLIAINKNSSFCKQQRHAFDATIIRAFKSIFLHLVILKNQHHKKKTIIMFNET